MSLEASLVERATPRGPGPEVERLVPFERARTLALAWCLPLGMESVALGAAAGRILAEAVVAVADIVPFARSAMDGFAVRARDVTVGTPLPLAAPVYAERGTRAHAAGTATPIATGAPLPAGADAVLAIEETRPFDDKVVPRDTILPGGHVFEAGDDARAGDTLAAAGEPLGAATLALLAANGSARLAVRRRPRVAVVTSGSEIVAIEREPGHGQIRNSNGVLLAAAVVEAGAEVVSLVHVADDARALQEALVAALAASDLVVTTGGASVGSRDFVKATLARLGAEFAFASVALRPAKPAAFGRAGDSLVAALPGNPAAAFVALHEFVIPAIHALGGRRAAYPPRVRARLAGTLRSKAERTFAAFAALRVAADGTLEAAPLRDQCSSLTRIASAAAALVIVPPGVGTLVPGTLVEVDVVDWRRLEAGAPRTAG